MAITEIFVAPLERDCEILSFLYIKTVCNTLNKYVTKVLSLAIRSQHFMTSL